MRPDQLERLKELRERLADEALVEMDPANWPGADTPREQWDAKTRGDRNWSMKNAQASVTLLVNLHRLTDAAGATTPPPEDEAAKEQREIDRAEAEARKLLDKVGGKRGRRASAEN